MIIDGGTVLTMDATNRVLASASIVIDGGAITELTDAPARSADERIDARGKVVIPGFVNTHTHLFQTLLRGAFDGRPFRDWLAGAYGCHHALTPEICESAGVLGALEAVRSGVTTALDHQYLNQGSEWGLATLAGIQRVGMRAVIARTIMDLPGLAPSSALEDAAAAFSATDDLMSAVRAADGQKMVTIMTGANTPGISSSGQLARMVKEYAESRGIACSEHIAESPEVAETVRAESGLGVIEWLEEVGGLGRGLLAAHAVHIARSEFELMRQRNISVAHNPISNMFLGDGIAPVPDYIAYGINVALGTDGASSNHSQSMLEVMKTAALLQRLHSRDPQQLSAQVVLRMATFNGARAIGLEDCIGSIEVGKRADLVVLDLDGQASTVGASDPYSAIVYGANPRNVDKVFIDGQLVLSGGELVGVDEETLLADARLASRRLTRALQSR